MPGTPLKRQDTTPASAFHHVNTVGEMVEPALPLTDSKKVGLSTLASLPILLSTQLNEIMGSIKNIVPYTLRTFNVVFYALPVTLVFILLAIQRATEIFWQAIYATSSGVENYPMAISFNEKMVDFISDLPKKGLFYKINFTIGTLLALETTLAALAVANLSVREVSKDLPVGILYYLIGTYCLNTIATRIYGATGSLEGIRLDIRDAFYRYCTDKGIYFQLRDDINRVWDQVKNELISGENPKATFAAQLYLQSTAKNIPSAKIMKERVRDIISRLSINIPRMHSAMLLPMWVMLAQKGCQLTGEMFGYSNLGENHPLVYSAAASGWMFYIKGSGLFAPAIARFEKNAHVKVKALYEALLPHLPTVATAAMYASLGAGWSLFFFTSGASGSGFAVVMQDGLNPANTGASHNSNDPYRGFGSAAGHLFRIVPFEWAFKTFIAPMGGYSALIASGVYINGGSLLNFISDCWDIQKKYDCSFSCALLKKMLGIIPKPHQAEEASEAREENSVVVDIEQPISLVEQWETYKKEFLKALEDCDFNKIEEMGLTSSSIKEARQIWTGPEKSGCCSSLFARKKEENNERSALLTADLNP